LRLSIMSIQGQREVRALAQNRGPAGPVGDFDDIGASARPLTPDNGSFILP
jgi:hypothetical protein